MIDLSVLNDCLVQTDQKIIMLVVDGLGGIANKDTKKTELETAHTPNLDQLASTSSCGLSVPVLPGITPGSGPGHLALFGYDPFKHFIGRGVLEALGIGVPIESGDVLARGNFCTVDDDGALIDRRAKRISSEFSEPLCQKLDSIKVANVDITVHPVKDYRFVLQMKGNSLSSEVSETDPQKIGLRPLLVKPLTNEATITASAINEFVCQANGVLSSEKLANMILLRGFAKLPNIPNMGTAYKLHPAAIAAYPMYRGLSSILGMDVIATGTAFEDEVATLERNIPNYDFFYLHYKPADTAGEDGDFTGKVQALEELDKFIPRIMKLNPDVLVVAGDHSTPSMIGAHSWHPVPLLIHSQWTHGEGVPSFSETSFRHGGLGTIPATNIMLLALAHSGKLIKYGP